MTALLTQRIDLLPALGVSMVVLCVLYGLVLLALSRKEPASARKGNAGPSGSGAPAVVFVLPCLDEEQVIGAGLQRLTELDHSRMHVLVVDDGSADATAAVVRAFPDPRISLLQRRPPEARQGKGEALNAAIRHIRSGGIVDVADPADVVVCVVDADGRLEPHVLEEVLPLFADAQVGAVQIGVRINNRGRSLLARLQDVEFVLHTEVFQRGRRHLGSVALGGNGQFVRLSALLGLGEAPWSRSLTEDLDLGVRLLVAGWRTDFRSTTSVHQQGLVGVRPWITQRTRWFQGHLQSWSLVPAVLRHLAGTARADLLYHLTSPFLLLVGSFLTAAFGLWTAGLAVGLATGTAQFSWWWVSSYLFSFGPAVLFGLVYWRQERAHGLRLGTAVLLVHLYVLYATLWYVAGWSACLRALRGRTSWSKTRRTTEDRELRPAGQVPALEGTA